jgi:hypothetical protein
MGKRAAQFRTGRRPSNATSVGHRPCPCACHNITPRMTCGLSPCGLLFAGIWRPPGASITENYVRTEPTRLCLVLAPGPCLRFEAVDFDASGKPNPFSSAMSATRNLVSDHARRIPARVFKIHEQGALAMNFTTAAVTEIIVCVVTATPLHRCFIQHVGVARNFDAEFVS